MVVPTVTPIGPISTPKPGQDGFQTDEPPPQPKINSPNKIIIQNYENPRYYGQSEPPKPTAREILQRSNLNTIPIKPPESSLRPEILSSTYATEKKTFVFDPFAKSEKFSSGTEQFREQTEQTISQLQEAKASGITRLELYDNLGNRVYTKSNPTGTTNPQDIVKARYDILKASIETGKEIIAKGSLISKDTITTFSRTEPKLDAGIVYKNTLDTLKNLPEYFKLGALKAANIIAGKEFENAKSVISLSKSGEAVPFVTFPTTSDKGISTNLIQSTSVLDIASILPFNVGIVGKGVSTLTSKIGLMKEIRAVQVMKSAIQEGELLTSAEKIKGTNIYEIFSGTASKSGISSFKPETANIIVERLPSGKIIAIKPDLPKYFKPILEITGIGKIGEKETIKESGLKELAERYPLFGQGKNDLSDLTKGEPFIAKPITETKPVFGKVTVEKPFEVILNPKLEGQSKTPYTLLNPKGSTAIITESQNKLPINKVLVKFEGTNPLEAAGLAAHYGLEPIKGMKDVFFGVATSHNIEKLAEGLKVGTLKEGANIFEFPTTINPLEAKVFVEAARNPEIISGKKLPEIIRPNVILTLFGRGLSHLKEKPSIIGKIDKTEKPFTATDLTGIGEKVGAGAAARSAELLKETLNVNKNINIKIKEPKETKDIFVTTSRSKTESGIKITSGADLIFETLAFPPSTEKKPSIRLSEGIESIITNKNDIIESNLFKNMSKTDIFENLKQSRTKLDTDVKSKEDTLLAILTGQETAQITSTRQITRQKTTFETITKPPGKRENPPKEPPILLLFPDLKKKEKKTKKISKKAEEFLGNVSVIDIEGVFKRGEITYGEKTIEKLLGKDIKKTSKGRLILIKKSGILFKNTKPLFTKSKSKKIKL